MECRRAESPSLVSLLKILYSPDSWRTTLFLYRSDTITLYLLLQDRKYQCFSGSGSMTHDDAASARPCGFYLWHMAMLDSCPCILDGKSACRGSQSETISWFLFFLYFLNRIVAETSVTASPGKQGRHQGKRVHIMYHDVCELGNYRVQRDQHYQS